jgi:hypothetical protein
MDLTDGFDWWIWLFKGCVPQRSSLCRDMSLVDMFEKKKIFFFSIGQIHRVKAIHRVKIHPTKNRFQNFGQVSNQASKEREPPSWPGQLFSYQAVAGKFWSFARKIGHSARISHRVKSITPKIVSKISVKSRTKHLRNGSPLSELMDLTGGFDWWIWLMDLTNVQLWLHKSHVLEVFLFFQKLLEMCSKESISQVHQSNPLMDLTWLMDLTDGFDWMDLTNGIEYPKVVSSKVFFLSRHVLGWHVRKKKNFFSPSVKSIGQIQRSNHILVKSINLKIVQNFGQVSNHASKERAPPSWQTTLFSCQAFVRKIGHLSGKIGHSARISPDKLVTAVKSVTVGQIHHVQGPASTALTGASVSCKESNPSK